MSGIKPKVLVPVALGTNRDYDLAVAFEAAGAIAERVPLAALRAGERALTDYQILAIPGGFSYGDALGAGRLFGLDLTGWFGDQLLAAHQDEMPILGICNGFQALVRAGLLPGDQPAVLTENASGRFECRWVQLAPNPNNNSIWLSRLSGLIRCPVAHGEGRFVAKALHSIEARSGVALRYVQQDGSPAGGEYPANPNGSARDVAAVTDPTGTVLGLMPHPENHIWEHQDLLRARSETGRTLGLFAAAIDALA